MSFRLPIAPWLQRVLRLLGGARTPAPKPGRRCGALQGSVTIGPEFCEPLPEEELAAWE